MQFTAFTKDGLDKPGEKYEHRRVIKNLDKVILRATISTSLYISSHSN